MRIENPLVAPALAQWQVDSDRVMGPNGVAVPIVLVKIHTQTGTGVYVLECDPAEKIGADLRRAAAEARVRMLTDPPRPGNGSAPDPLADLQSAFRRLQEGPPGGPRPS